MRKCEISTSTRQLVNHPTVIMIRDELSKEIAHLLKEEVPNLKIVENSSELSEFIEEHIKAADVYIVTDVIYKFMRNIDEPDKNISWVYCEVHSLN